MPAVNRLLSVALVVAAAVAGCSAASPATRPPWPVAPEVLPSATTGAPSSEYGKATRAIDSAYDKPGPATTALHILVWEIGCSGGSPTTGRMSAPFVAMDSSSVTITIGVRPLSGAQTCPGPRGTPALVNLPEPIGARTLLDGGTDPPAPPSR